MGRVQLPEGHVESWNVKGCPRPRVPTAWVSPWSQLTYLHPVLPRLQGGGEAKGRRMKEVPLGPEGHQLLSDTRPGAQGPRSLGHAWRLRVSSWQPEFAG